MRTDGKTKKLLLSWANFRLDVRQFLSPKRVSHSRRINEASAALKNYHPRSHRVRSSQYGCQHPKGGEGEKAGADMRADMPRNRGINACGT